MHRRHSTGFRQLLQRFRQVGAIGVTVLPFTAGGAAAEPFADDMLPAGIVTDEPSLTLISPLEGLTLEAYGPADPYDLLTRLRFGFSLDYEDNNRIAAERKWFARHPDYLERVLTRAQRYMPYITAEIERRGLPYELALLPIVESAYDPFAYSHGRAAGLWQMIPGTARRFGVRQNWWYDGRRDVVDSTRAALDYTATGSTRSPPTTPVKATCFARSSATAKPASPKTSGTSSCRARPACTCRNSSRSSISSRTRRPTT
jgi:membrane-bound lytic murein transglycosylase D